MHDPTCQLCTNRRDLAVLRSAVAGFVRSRYLVIESDSSDATVAALTELAADGAVPASTAAEAITKYDLNPDKPDPARA